MLGFQRLSKVIVGTVGGDLPNEDACIRHYATRKSLEEILKESLRLSFRESLSESLSESSREFKEG